MKPYRPSPTDRSHHPNMVRMFDRVSESYDLANHIMSLGLDVFWRRKLVKSVGLRAGNAVLDACTGTGDVAIELSNRGYRVTGLDASHGMLRIARQKAPSLAWRHGDCRDLPFEDGTFDAVTVSFGIRNIGDRITALREFRRVVKPGGRLLVMEAMLPTNPVMKILMSTYERVMFPICGRLYGDAQPSSRYLVQTIAGFGTPDEFERELARAGWRPVPRKTMIGGGVVLFRAMR